MVSKAIGASVCVLLSFSACVIKKNPNEQLADLANPAGSGSGSPGTITGSGSAPPSTSTSSESPYRTAVPVSLEWTDLTTFKFDAAIYVSNSSGLDTNEGNSPSSPVKTLAKAQALLFAAETAGSKSVELLLKSGDLWDGQQISALPSLPSVDEKPIVITSYGTGARPTIKAYPSAVQNGGTNAVGQIAFSLGESSKTTNGVNNVYIIGIHFLAGGTDAPYGLYWGVHGQNLRIEDCVFEGFWQNLALVAGGTGLNTATLFRNQSINSRNDFLGLINGQLQAKPTGMYATGVNGLYLIENLFADNARYLGKVAAHPYYPEFVFFAHQIYLAQENTDTFLLGNIVINTANTDPDWPAGPDGMQLRGGAVVENNLIVGSSSTFNINVGPAKIDQNVILETSNYSLCTHGLTPASENCPAGVSGTGPSIGAGGAGDLVDYADIEDNVVAHAKSSTVGSPFSINNVSGMAVATGNIVYDYPGTASISTTTVTGLTAKEFEQENEVGQTGYCDPNRNFTTYMAAGGSKTQFITNAEAQSRTAWNQSLMAVAFNNYIRAGFTKGSTCPTTP
jgi:hypothetical protein